MHWIYVMGDHVYRRRAQDWSRRKSSEGKRYAVIESSEEEQPAGRLGHVGVDDVVYVYGPMTTAAPFRIGNRGLSPDALAALLAGEGLPVAHRTLKVFASHSGDDIPVGAEEGSFAAQVHRAMAATYPQLRVYGYLGAVSPAGPSSHKTAGMEEEEDPRDIPPADWEARGLRAQANRVVFGPTADPANSH